MVLSIKARAGKTGIAISNGKRTDSDARGTTVSCSEQVTPDLSIRHCQWVIARVGRRFFPA
ncbi:hypothetical protein CKA32_005940 [Geitlerinema sp. FC II]|nr:hypothetical protein CKA32_005940 [Geitlerinema sp. FC II]